MSKAKLFLTYAAIICAVACTHSNESTSSSRSYSLTGIKIDLDTASGGLLDPWMLFVEDTVLMVYNVPLAAFPYTLIDLSGNRVMGHSNPHLDGYFPYRSRHARNLELSFMSSVGILNIDSMISGSPNVYRELARIPGNEFLTSDFTDDSYQVTQLWNINDSTFLADGLFPVGRLGLFDPAKGQVTSTYFNFPDTSVMVSDKMKSIAYVGLFSSHPGKNLFVRAYMESDWVEILELADGRLKQRASTFSYLPRYTIENEVIAQSSGSNTQGNVALDVTENLIFILRSDRTIHESSIDGRIYWKARKVFVDNWSGEVIGQIELDQEAEAMSVDEAGRLLYVYVRSPEEGIYLYRLPEPLAD